MSCQIFQTKIFVYGTSFNSIQQQWRSRDSHSIPLVLKYQYIGQRTFWSPYLIILQVSIPSLPISLQNPKNGAIFLKSNKLASALFPENKSDRDIWLTFPKSILIVPSVITPPQRFQWLDCMKYSKSSLWLDFILSSPIVC